MYKLVVALLDLSVTAAKRHLLQILTVWDATKPAVVSTAESVTPSTARELVLGIGMLRRLGSRNGFHVDGISYLVQSCYTQDKCTYYSAYEESLPVSRIKTVVQQYTVKSRTSCSFWGSSSCTVIRVRYTTGYRTTYFTVSQTSYFCCPGYSALANECKPVCSPTCKNSGTCTSPGRCHCSSGWTGSGCTTPECDTGCAANGGTCKAPFKCLCSAGLSGPSCQTACSGDHFGPNCAQRCSCQNAASCEPVTGACNCAAGWQGMNCDKACPTGTYGLGCLPCKCQNGASCDHVTGSCTCPTGYYGKS
ncbi:multiple epidermal growth factor-like domains protein 6 [Corticium candelabrum]|uniref:multiple epidermal growth factor-like domains protein 6 n=1 Tax=Corticium candelabrum TaxID=121492 RepID=UPI002E25E4B6|nr:multiple epidermal growth factor-like domains protein 6 [Corticium candelabrum]